MKRTLFLLLLVWGCKSHEEQTNEKLEAGIRQYFTDLSFREKAKFEIIELNGIHYTQVSRTHMDSVGMSLAKRYQSNFIDLVNSNANLGQSKMDLARLSGELGNGGDRDMYLRDAKKVLNEMQSYSDSLDHYKAYDSIFALRAKQGATLPKEYYHVKFFLKANLAEKNYLDSGGMYLDKNYRFVDVTNIHSIYSLK